MRAMGSAAQAAKQARNIERPETIVIKPADVGLEKSPQIRHPIFQHGDAVDPEAPGKPLIDIGIKPAISKDVRMHHAAAQNFKPILALAKPYLAALAGALDIDFHRWFGERKIARP